MTDVLTDIDLDEIEGVRLAPEALKVVQWRNEWLRAAGYSRRNAKKIAYATEINWHIAYDIRKQCDNEELCMEVLFGREE